MRRVRSKPILTPEEQREKDQRLALRWTIAWLVLSSVYRLAQDLASKHPWSMTSAGNVALALLLAVGLATWPSLFRVLTMIAMLLPVSLLTISVHWLHTTPLQPYLVQACLQSVIAIGLLVGVPTRPRRLIVLGLAVALAPMISGPTPWNLREPQAAVCDARVADVEQKLVRASVRARLRDLTKDDVTLPSFEATEDAVHTYPRLLLAEHETSIDGVKLEGTERERLDELRAHLPRATQDKLALEDRAAVYVVLERGLELRRVLPLLQAAAQDRWLLLVSANENPGIELPVPEGVEKFARELPRAARTTSRKAKLVARELAMRSASCKELSTALFDDAWRKDPTANMASVVSKSLRACKCGAVDLKGLEYVLMRALQSELPSHKLLSVRIDERAATEIVLSPEASLQDFADAIHAQKANLDWSGFRVTLR